MDQNKSDVNQNKNSFSRCNSILVNNPNLDFWLIKENPHVETKATFHFSWCQEQTD